MFMGLQQSSKGFSHNLETTFDSVFTKNCILWVNIYNVATELHKLLFLIHSFLFFYNPTFLKTTTPSRKQSSNFSLLASQLQFLSAKCCAMSENHRPRRGQSHERHALPTGRPQSHRREKYCHWKATQTSLDPGFTWWVTTTLWSLLYFDFYFSKCFVSH